MEIKRASLTVVVDGGAKKSVEISCHDGMVMLRVFPGAEWERDPWKPEFSADISGSREVSSALDALTEHLVHISDALRGLLWGAIHSMLASQGWGATDVVGPPREICEHFRVALAK